MKAQIDVLRGKIGIKPDNPGIQKAESNIAAAAKIINDPKATDDARQAALKAVQDADSSAAQIENPLLLASSVKAAQAQGLVTGIESYLAGLTGGAVSLSSPAVASAPLTATARSRRCCSDSGECIPCSQLSITLRLGVGLRDASDSDHSADGWTCPPDGPSRRFRRLHGGAC